MKSKVRFNLQGTARGKGDGTVSSSEALSRSGLCSTPVIGVMASLKEDPSRLHRTPLAGLFGPTWTMSRAWQMPEGSRW